MIAELNKRKAVGVDFSELQRLAYHRTIRRAQFYGHPPRPER